MSHVPLSTIPTIPFTPAALGSMVPGPNPGDPLTFVSHPSIEFFLRVPSWEDRDMIGLRLYQMNVKEVTGEHIQALMLSEAFEIWPEDEADDNARFLEGFWQRQTQHQRDLEAWSEQEAQRRIDEKESGMTYEPAPVPTAPTTVRERARAALLNQDIIDRSQRVRDKLVQQQMYTKLFNIAIARMHIVGWSGLDATAAFEGELLTKATIESLRGDLMKEDPTGNAWLELVDRIEQSFSLPRSAEKNSSSPPVSTSPPNGSSNSNTGSDTASPGGSSSSEATAETPRSSTAPTPAPGSAKTTATSSGSSPGSGRGKRKPGQTAAS